MPRRRRCTFGTITLLFSLSIVAGNSTALEPAAAFAPQPAESANTYAVCLSLDFEGGTATDYLDALRDAAKSANIVVMPGAEHVLMPPVQLKAVALSSAVDLLNNQQSVDEDGMRYILSVDQIESDRFELSNDDRRREGIDSLTTLPVFVVNVDSEPARLGDSDQTRLESQVWALEPLLQLQLQPLSADDVLATIDVALPLAAEGEPEVEIRFHEETGILIARGDFRALQMVDNVLNQLEGSAHALRKADEQSRRAQEMESAFQEVREHMEKLTVEREHLAQEAEKIHSRMRELERVMDQLRAELDERSAVISELRSHIVQLETALGRKNDKK